MKRFVGGDRVDIAVQSQFLLYTAVEIVLRDNDLVVMKRRKSAFDLDQLLALVTDDNVHHEVESGPAQGVEAW